MSILNVKKQEVESLKKNIKSHLQQGRDINEIESYLLKKYPKKFVDFVLKDFLKKEKSDAEWVKNFRKKNEDEMRKKSYLTLINYALTSLVVGITMRFVIWQFEKSQEMIKETGLMTGGMDLFGTLLIAFYVIFWGCVFVFVGTLGFAIYKKHTIYKINKKIFKEEQELKRKKSEEEQRKRLEKERKEKEEPKPQPKEEKKQEVKEAVVKEEKKPQQKITSNLPKVITIGNRKVIQYQDAQKANVLNMRNRLLIRPSIKTKFSRTR